ncbi:histidinol-phosphate transaminase [Nitrococcus mobilis]|uniref:Histidinol-phosphate aminotransferase n=1 Tax=Nitrococcus mobilis Nb-231 TaxID=314278 RepID=A4BM51_9GAMM|nr:histidinol-phosphate transaminase [Nitrococcus mobilis]EAR23389.1 putative aminotransferase [Nitrococcus mobilis Nb-231]
MAGSDGTFDFCDLVVPGVRELQPYQPGKPIGELAREYGLSESRIVKLASNENPLGPSPKAIEAVRQAVQDAHRYPDGNGHALRSALAERHGITPERILLGNGSNDLLDLVARTFLGSTRQAVYAQHAFAVYPIATRSAGAEGIVAPANGVEHRQPYGHDLAAMTACITPRTRVVFLANPNNPTGTWLAAEELEVFLETVPGDVIVVVDEAYVEYAQGLAGYREVSGWLDRFPNLLITRTFSKAHGLAGLRVGYALCRADIVEFLNRVRHPFNVNSLAQVGATAALADPMHVARTVELNHRERKRLTEDLRRLNLRVLPAAGNFLCVEIGSQAAAVNEALLRDGIIVRPLAGYALPRFLRVSLGTGEENDRFMASLQQIHARGLLEVTA